MTENAISNAERFLKNTKVIVNLLIVFFAVCLISIALFATGARFGVNRLELTWNGFILHRSETTNNFSTNAPGQEILVKPGSSFSRQGLVKNESGTDWIIANCENKNQVAISGLCTIDSENGFGWMLQNAGLTGKNAAGLDTWGCAYRRGIFVSGTAGDVENSFNLFHNGQWQTNMPTDIKGAAATAKATATVFCVELQR